MCLILDWALILISSFITVSSYRRIVKNKCSSMAHFIVLIEYIFLCVPILLNYCLGIPTYKYISWYKPFLPSMESEAIAHIYDIYILASIVLLYCYARSYDRKKSKYKKYEDIKVIAYTYPISWAMASLGVFLYYNYIKIKSKI